MITNFNELEKLQSEKVTFVIGTFDILHAGHLFFLEESKRSGNNNKLLVGVIPDKIVAERKGAERPVVHEEERALLLDSLKLVDYVFIAPEKKIGEVTEEVIRLARPECAVISKSAFDTRENPKEISGTKLVIVEDEVINRSSTAIINKIKENYKCEQ